MVLLEITAYRHRERKTGVVERSSVEVVQRSNLEAVQRSSLQAVQRSSLEAVERSSLELFRLGTSASMPWFPRGEGAPCPPLVGCWDRQKPVLGRRWLLRLLLVVG